MNSALMYNAWLYNYKFIFIIYLTAVNIGIGFFVIIIGFCIFVAIGSMRTHSGSEKIGKVGDNYSVFSSFGICGGCSGD